MFRQDRRRAPETQPAVEVHGVGQRAERPRRPYVVVANHESFVDILLISHMPFEMKWMSKSEIFKIPFVGWGMRMAGDIGLDRGDRQGRRAALDRVPRSARASRSR